MTKEINVQIIIAHYGLTRKITREECEAVLEDTDTHNIFVDFESGNAELRELYDLPFATIALSQHRKFIEVLKPALDKYPSAHIAYFGLAPIPVAFHLGHLVGNTHSYTIYQWHHNKHTWYAETAGPSEEYVFQIKPTALPQEIQKGSGNVIVRIGTSFAIDRQSTYQVLKNPANEFDIELLTPHLDSLFSQKNIDAVVNEFQNVLNAYSSLLTEREQIHLFISSSAGLPFALGTRINTNIYPYVQTYQYDRSQSPAHKEAILITRDVIGRAVLSDEDKKVSKKVRKEWDKQLQDKIKPFIQAVTGTQTENWLQTTCASDSEYKTVSRHLHFPWDKVIDIGATSLLADSIDFQVTDVEGFEYFEKSSSWALDDGFLSGLKKRLEKTPNTDLLQAARLFFFHEALHYSKLGHNLTREIADGIGQFPKVIEEADYQADAWALMNEYRYCCIHESQKLKPGLKVFFCNAIETAVETMWSFVDTGTELNSIQIRSMNRFLNWYWQYLAIESLNGKGTLDEIVFILFNKPVIELAGAPMELRGHRTFYKLNITNTTGLQLAAFVNNRVHRFAPTLIDQIVEGFKYLKGDKIKEGLKSFQVSIR